MSSKLDSIIMGVKAHIQEHKLETGALLPSESELCAIHSASKMTVVKALEKLNREGAIYRKKGVGSFVATNPLNAGGEVILLFPDNITSNISQLLLSGGKEALISHPEYALSMEIYPTGGDSLTAIKNVYHRHQNSLRGFLFFPQPIPYSRDVNARVINWFHLQVLPFMVLDRLQEKDHTPNYVSSDNIKGGRMAAAKLFADAYQYFAFVYADRGVATIDRQEGFVQELIANGIPENSIEIIHLPQRYDQWLPTIANFLRRRALFRHMQEIGTEAAAGGLGIFACNHEIASCIQLEVSRQNLRTPHQVGLMSYCDGLPLAEQQQISEIIQYPKSIGKIAVQKLLEQIKSPANPVTPHVHDVHLLSRGSTRS